MIAPFVQRDNLSISPKENYKLVLEHEKPMYTPLATDVVSILPDVVLSVRKITRAEKAGSELS